jgi:hypothetical protein
MKRAAHEDALERLGYAAAELDYAEQAVKQLRDDGLACQRTLKSAVEWFDEHRPQWGPGTLPAWYVDAKRVLDATKPTE